MYPFVNSFLNDPGFFADTLAMVIAIAAICLGAFRYPDQVSGIARRIWAFLLTPAGMRVGLMSASVLLKFMPSSAAWFTGEVLQPAAMGLTAGGLSAEQKKTLEDAKALLEHPHLPTALELASIPGFPEIVQQLPALLKNITPTAPAAAAATGGGTAS